MTGITGFCLIERLLHFNIHGKLHAYMYPMIKKYLYTDQQKSTDK